MGEVLPLSIPRHTVVALDYILASDIQMRSVSWVDEPLIQGSAFTLVAGPKGTGKGTWLCKVAANFTNGVYGEKRNVLFISSEDSYEIDLAPRLEVAGAIRDRVPIIASSFTLPADLLRLRQLALEFEDVGMIVIDPIGNHLGGKDTDKEGVVRNAIAGLNHLADELGCCVFGVRHVGKNRQNGSLSAILGSTAWKDVPRAVLMFAPDNEDDMVFHVAVVAGNRSGRKRGESFRFDLVAPPGLPGKVTKCVALGASTKDVDDLLMAPRGLPSRSEKARELILDILDKEGEQESDSLDARVADEASITAKTVKKLRQELRERGLIKSQAPRDETGKISGKWYVVRTNAPRP